MSSKITKIVLADGCFDVLHIGHLFYLQAARAMGDRLVVSVTRNQFVNKGPGRPVNDELHRMALIGALKPVDEVVLVDGSLDALERVLPHIFCKGKDYIGRIQSVHQAFCDAHGIEIKFANTPLFSATKIINDRLRYG